MLFYVRNSLQYLGSTLALTNVLRNWNRIWIIRELALPREVFGTPAQPAYSAVRGDERWRRSGFMKDAGEFWLLAKFMFDDMESTSHGNGRLSAFGDDGPADTFDQITMRDLRRLVSHFNRALVGRYSAPTVES